MNLETQQKHFEQFVEKQRKIFFKKGNDYSNSDRLSNFKLSGAIIGTTPELQCLSLIATKVARLGVLLNTNVVNNESINDSVLDLANYAMLLDMILENKYGTNTTGNTSI